jgi:hypothetical protein
MDSLMLQKEKKNEGMVLIERSVEACRSLSIAARSLVGPTSRRRCRRADFEEVLNNKAQYPRIPSKVLKKVHRMKKSSVLVEAVNNEVIDLERMECGDTQISCIAA